MGREYLAVVQGDVPLNGTIDAPIGRHSKDRKRMAVNIAGKAAVTHYQMQERFPQSQPQASLVSVKLETGRTHQIRVHMTHIGHPLLGDPVYGRRRVILPRVLADDDIIGGFPRQALHATRLSLNHPDSEQWLSFTAEPPADFAGLCTALRRLKH
jgi:23S rRNA pseudouridine1911/1915/1917 synthase